MDNTDNKDCKGYNPTVELIISRLPKKDLVSPREIADAFGLATATTVMSAIEEGKLPSVKVGGRYLISRQAAIDYIISTAV